ncbi:MAG: hypothetical protein LAN63_08360 [Acidobacteriia bacterium]|nr:hypothetical protein [Terriglobia bacterium]
MIPTGVKLIAAAFLLAATYFLGVGIIMLLRPGTISLTAGAPLLGGLEVAGPYMFLLAGAAGTAVGLGLLRLNNWARWIAIIIAMLGVILLVPSVSSSVAGFQMGRLAWGALGVILRVMIVFYLFQEPVAQAFKKP